MFLFRTATDQNIIKISERTFKIILSYQIIHQTLKTGDTVGHTEWKSFEMKKVSVSFKSSIWHITFLDTDLMVSTFQVYSAK